MSTSLPSYDLSRLLQPALPPATKQSAGESRLRPEDCGLFTTAGVTDSLHAVNWED